MTRRLTGPDGAKRKTGSEAGGGSSSQHTATERRILALAAEGHSNDWIAHELAIAPSTVAEHLARVRQRAGCASSLAIVAAAASGNWDPDAAERLARELRGGRRVAPLRELTPSERDVVAAVIEGMHTTEIAEQRGSSARTVANQLANVYRKLGVVSRRELVARVATAWRGDPSPQTN